MSRSLGLLKDAKRFLPLKSRKDNYSSIIDLNFRYCCAVGLIEIQKLQKRQNSAARAAGIITGSNFNVPSKHLIETLGWRKIEKLIQHELWFSNLEMNFPRKVSLNCLSAAQVMPVIIFDVLLLTLDCRRKCRNGQKRFSFRGAALWNSFPSKSKQTSNLISFKKSISKRSL